jgi:hypothetical protein
MPLAVVERNPEAEVYADRFIAALTHILETTEAHRLAIRQAEAGNPPPIPCHTCPHQYDRCGALGGRCNPICV